MISLQTFLNHSAISIESELTQSNSSRNSCIKLKDYNIIKQIGQGTFSDVFLARKVSTGKVYALKVVSINTFSKKILSPQAANDHFMSVFLNEKKIMSEINHPFLNHLEQSFITKNKYCLVSQFFQGGELSSYLLKIRKFSERITKFYTAQILLALEYLHENNIIFRE